MSIESLSEDCQPPHELALATAYLNNAVLRINAAVESVRQIGI